MCCYNILFSSVFAHFSFCQLMKNKTYFTSSVPQWPPKLQTLNKCNKQTNESINLPFSTISFVFLALQQHTLQCNCHMSEPPRCSDFQ